MQEIGLDEVKDVMKKMKKGKAVRPDDIPTEVWKCLEMTVVVFLTGLFNDISQSKKMPDKWEKEHFDTNFQRKRRCTSVCTTYRGI